MQLKVGRGDGPINGYRSMPRSTPLGWKKHLARQTIGPEAIIRAPMAKFFSCIGVVAGELCSTEGSFPHSSSGFKSWLRQYFFSFLLSLWTVLRSNPSSAKQWILQMQLAVMSRAKNYKQALFLLPL